MNKYIVTSLLATSLITTSVMAAECNFTCNNDGSTVVISKSCDLSKSIDCRGNNLELENNVILNIKPGANLMLDLKNHKLIVKPGARINISKDSGLKDGLIKPDIITFQTNYDGIKETTTLPDLYIHGPRGRDSSDHYRTYTVPKGVNHISVSLTVSYREEPCCDGLRPRIYKNGRLVKDFGRLRRSGTKTFTYDLDVSPGDVIKVGAHQYHDRSVSRGDSKVYNINISYTKPDADIKYIGSSYNVKTIAELSIDGGKTFPYKYTLSYDEAHNKEVHNILGKKGLTDYVNNPNSLVARIKICPLGVDDNSNKCLVSNSVKLGYINPNYVPPVDISKFDNIMDQNHSFRRSSNGRHGYDNDKIYSRVNDGRITIYNTNKVYDLKNLKYFEAQIGKTNISAPDCRSNSARIGINGDKLGNKSAIQIGIYDDGSYGWSYHGGSFDRVFGNLNYQLLNNERNGSRMLTILIRDNSGKRFRWIYPVREIYNLLGAKIKGWIDLTKKQVHLELYKPDGTKVLDKTFNIDLPKNGVNLENMGKGNPFAAVGITCTRGGVPFSRQEIYFKNSYVGLQK